MPDAGAVATFTPFLQKVSGAGIFQRPRPMRPDTAVTLMIPEDQALHDAGAEIGGLLLARRMKLAAAESCTGGWLSKVVTEVAGCSDWFDCSFVAYSYEAKESMLGVSRVTLEEHGAVSEETVVEMVRGALSRSRANVAVAITGIAGPSGGTRDKPVGLVHFAVATGEATRNLKKAFDPSWSRDQIRHASVVEALKLVKKAIGG